MEQDHLSNLVRNYFTAYEKKEKGMLEELLSQDFTFSSPANEKINRETYFETCWPSCIEIEKYDIQNIFVDGNEVFVRYECKLKSGATIRNMEHFQFNGMQLKDIVVYFGFDKSGDPFDDVKVKRFSKAFASGDVDYIVENVTEDIQWNFIGESEIRGREAVANMLEPMRGVAAKEYRTKNMMTHENKAIIEGTMKMPTGNGEEKMYAFCDIYTFDQIASNTIKDLSAYLIELPSGVED